MDDTLYDLVIENIDGSKLPDMSHFSAAAVTRAQTNQEKAYRNLISLIRSLAKIKRHLNRLKIVTPN